MKDRVFIAWSGSNEEAKKVKRILETQYNYVCCIGGNADNSSKFSSVGDTVIQQIKTCNQAIVIFQNRADGAVSNNLFFELGYVLSMYGTRKIHCVKRSDEDVVLPSDFDNSFVQPISDTEKPFAEGIVDYFMSRQKMSVNENKMFLINNRYLLHDKIESHYSEAGSKCSDYELAQYVLFYMQAAHMFGDEKKVYNEMHEFKQRHNYEFSGELALAVNICLSFFNMVIHIKLEKDTSEVYIDRNIFWSFKSEYEHYIIAAVDDDIGIFDEWANVFIYEHLTFAYMLYANNNENNEMMRKMLHSKSKEYAYKTIEAIEILCQRSPCRENNDEIGLISLVRAYVYRNLFLSKKILEEDDAGEWLRKTLDVRASLKNNFTRGTVDTQLYNNFCMEYYLSLVNYLDNKHDIDPFEKLMYRSEMLEYVQSVQEENNSNAYIQQIAMWCNRAEI